MANFTVVFDANVLYPAPLRDLLMSVALTEQFRAKWTDEIHDEWVRNLLKNRRDITKLQLQKTVDKMNAVIPDSVVENYEGFIECLNLPDPNDRHVLAAAIKCNADVIVTNNLKDFPASELKKYGVEAQSPDVFLNHLYDLNSTAFCSAVHQQRKRLKTPTYSAEKLLDTFYKQGLPLIVSKLKNNIDLI
ncbi:MAG: PIN domain-containing protein [Methylococcales bacterium]